MTDLIGQIMMQVRAAWRFRWYAIAAAWLAALVGWAVVLSLPNKYEARARVYVDADTVLKPLLNGLTVSTDVTSRVGMISRMLLARPNLERVARETDLAKRTTNPTEFAAMVAGLSQAITLEGGGGNNVYTLKYTDGDPVMAERVVHTLLNTFLENTLGDKRADTDSAQQFLMSQIRDYELKLRNAEDRLADFKKRNVGLMPGETGDYYTRLQSAMAQLDDLRAKQRLAVQRSAELSKQLEGEEPTFGLFTESATAGTPDARIADLQRQLDQLLLQYTDKHPRVIALKEEIAQLQAESAEKEQKRKKGAAGVPVPHSGSDAAGLALDINPVYQNLRVEQSRTQVQLAELQQQVGDQERLVNNLRSRVDTIPEIEAELTRLNRDYEVNKAQHQALLQRLESARLSEQADSSTERVKFRVIEPPVVPLLPTGPKRALFVHAVLLAALGAGGALAVLLSQLNPVFLSRRMLAGITGLPVLGAIAHITSDSQRRAARRDSILIGACLAGLLFAYVAIIALSGSIGRLVHTVMT